MRIVYELETAKKNELQKVLDADPYSKPSFAVNGYKLRDGTSVGQDKAKNYLYLKGPDSFMPFAEAKLKDLAVRCKPEIEKAIADLIDGEEAAAEGGFGSIFG
jgi:hypothetical protein